MFASSVHPPAALPSIAHLHGLAWWTAARRIVEARRQTCDRKEHQRRCERRKERKVAADVLWDYRGGMHRVVLAKKYQISWAAAGRIIGTLTAVERRKIKRMRLTRYAREYERRQREIMPGNYRTASIPIVAHGVPYKSITEAALALGVSPSSGHKFHRRGIRPEDWPKHQRRKRDGKGRVQSGQA